MLAVFGCKPASDSACFGLGVGVGFTNRIDPSPREARRKLGCLIWQFGDLAELGLALEKVLFVIQENF